MVQILSTIYHVGAGEGHLRNFLKWPQRNSLYRKGDLGWIPNDILLDYSLQDLPLRPWVEGTQL